MHRDYTTMEFTAEDEQDLHDFMQSLCNKSPPQQHKVVDSADDIIAPTASSAEDDVLALLAEFTHSPDEEATFDILYDTVSGAIENEEEDLGYDSEDEGSILEQCGEEEEEDNDDYTGCGCADKSMQDMGGEEGCAVPNFCHHVSAVKEDCSGCDHLRHLVGADSKDVSASLTSSSVDPHRMTDLQLAQRALTFNIYDFDVSSNPQCIVVIFLFISNNRLFDSGIAEVSS